MNLRVNLQRATAAAGVPSRATLAAWARAALAGVRRHQVAVTIRVVGKNESKSLNSRFRGKQKPTNVLSFPFEPPPGTRSDLLGDVVICADVVRREAGEQGKTARAHWAHMVVHGIMHLRGYDHETSEDAAVMEAREVRVLRALGFPNPYA
jgi:probable rRNA maturation factor